MFPQTFWWAVKCKVSMCKQTALEGKYIGLFAGKKVRPTSPQRKTPMNFGVLHHFSSLKLPPKSGTSSCCFFTRSKRKVLRFGTLKQLSFFNCKPTNARVFSSLQNPCWELKVCPNAERNKSRWWKKSKLQKKPPKPNSNKKTQQKSPTKTKPKWIFKQIKWSHWLSHPVPKYLVSQLTKMENQEATSKESARRPGHCCGTTSLLCWTWDFRDTSG